MTQFDMNDFKKNLSKISKLLENGEEDCVILSRNGKPVLKVTLYEENPRKHLFGCAKGVFKVPDDFDDINISKDFEGEIFSC